MVSLPLPSGWRDLPAAISTLRRWKEELVSALDFPPIAKPSMVDVSQDEAGEFDVEHLLGRKPQGWVESSPETFGRVREVSRDAKRLRLECDAAVKCTVWVW